MNFQSTTYPDSKKRITLVKCDEDDKNRPDEKAFHAFLKRVIIEDGYCHWCSCYHTDNEKCIRPF